MVQIILRTQEKTHFILFLRSRHLLPWSQKTAVHVAGLVSGTTWQLWRVCASRADGHGRPNADGQRGQPCVRNSHWHQVANSSLELYPNWIFALLMWKLIKLHFNTLILVHIRSPETLWMKKSCKKASFVYCICNILAFRENNLIVPPPLLWVK